MNFQVTTHQAPVESWDNNALYAASMHTKCVK